MPYNAVLGDSGQRTRVDNDTHGAEGCLGGWAQRSRACHTERESGVAPLPS